MPCFTWSQAIFFTEFFTVHELGPEHELGTSRLLCVPPHILHASWGNTCTVVVVLHSVISPVTLAGVAAAAAAKLSVDADSRLRVAKCRRRCFRIKFTRVPIDARLASCLLFSSRGLNADTLQHHPLTPPPHPSDETAATFIPQIIARRPWHHDLRCCIRNSATHCSARLFWPNNSSKLHRPSCTRLSVAPRPNLRRRLQLQL